MTDIKLITPQDQLETGEREKGFGSLAPLVNISTEGSSAEKRIQILNL